MAKDVTVEQGARPGILGAKVEFAWAVIKTKQSMEVTCRECLERAGFEVYLPMYQRVSKRLRRTYPAAFIPSYLFVKISAATPKWWSMYSARGVSAVMGGESPLLIRDAALDLLRTREEAGFVQLITEKEQALPDFKKGDRVKVVDGVFKGMELILREPVDRKRTWLLASWLSGSDSLTPRLRVDWRDLRPA